MSSVAIIATIHNRKALTMKFLASLAAQELPSNCDLNVLIVDDGSTDGSAEAINEMYPDMDVVRADGSLYWGGGMEFAMGQVREKYDPDAIIWANNDIELQDNVILSLLGYLYENSRSIVGITITDEATGKVPVYGGRFISPWNLAVSRVQPSDVPVNVDCLNGNFLVVPRVVFECIGNVQGYIFRHGAGDFDYTLRAKKAGFDVVLLPGIGGRSLDDHVPMTHKKHDGIVCELKRLFSIKGMYPKGWWVLCLRYSRLGPLLFLWSYFKRIVIIVLLRRHGLDN